MSTNPKIDCSNFQPDLFFFFCFFFFLTIILSTVKTLNNFQKYTLISDKLFKKLKPSCILLNFKSSCFECILGNPVSFMYLTGLGQSQKDRATGKGQHVSERMQSLQRPSDQTSPFDFRQQEPGGSPGSDQVSQREQCRRGQWLSAGHDTYCMPVTFCWGCLQPSAAAQV